MTCTVQRLSVESQKGAITVQRCSIEHQKGVITYCTTKAPLLVFNGTSLNIDSALLTLS